MNGCWRDRIEWSASLFRTDSDNTSLRCPARSRGAAIHQCALDQRQGMDLTAAVCARGWSAHASYSIWTPPTNSPAPCLPNNPRADAAGN